MDKLLLEPLAHFKQVPREREFHALLWHAFNFWFKVPEDRLKELSYILKELTIVTVTMDDVMDNSRMRRGIPVTHLVYGRPMTIYGLIFKIAQMLELLLNYNIPNIIDYYVEMGLCTFRGQGLELYFTRNVICPTEEEYGEVIAGKATEAILFSLQLLQAFSKEYQTTNFRKFMNYLASFYQIHNDYRSLDSKSYACGRVFAEDITEGKFTHPFIHAVRSHPEDKQIIDILRQRTTDEKLKKRVVQLLEQYGSLDYTLQTLQDLINGCIEEMKKIGKNPEMEKVLGFALKNIETSLTF